MFPPLVVAGYAVDSTSSSTNSTSALTYNDPTAVYIFFLYYSAAITTGTGFGDMSPVNWYAQMASNSQMLFGMIYHAGIFAFTLDYFMKLKQRQRAAEEAESQRVLAEAAAAEQRLAERLATVGVPNDSIVRATSEPDLMRVQVTLASSTTAEEAEAVLAVVSPSRLSRANSEVNSSGPSSPASPHHLTTLPTRIILSNPTSPSPIMSPTNSMDQEEEDLLWLGVGMLDPVGRSVDAHQAPAALMHASLMGTLQSRAPVSAVAISTTDSSRAPRTTFFGRCAFWRALKQRAWFERCRRFVIRRLLLIALLLQALATSLMFALDEPFTGLTSGDVVKVAVLVFASLLLLIQMVLNGSINIRLLNKVAHGTFTKVRDERGDIVAIVPRAGLSASFLSQSYVSTILVFGAIYFYLFAFMVNLEFSQAKVTDVGIMEMCFRFCYFSVTVMTGTGFGDIYARGVVARMSEQRRRWKERVFARHSLSSMFLILSFALRFHVYLYLSVVFVQMLISVLYSCLIISLGMFVLCEQVRTPITHCRTHTAMHISSSVRLVCRLLSFSLLS